MISKKDKKRIEEARDLNPIYWNRVYEWAEEAEDTDAREELEFIGKIKYRAEEASAGVL